MNNRILIDSSFLFAVFHQQDVNHEQAKAFNANTTQVPLVPDIILPEVSFLFLRDVGYHALEPFLKNLAAIDVQLTGLDMADVQRAREIVGTYPKARFDLVDACIMALAERLEITQVCTFDRRDFSIFRPQHCSHLELLP